MNIKKLKIILFLSITTTSLLPRQRRLFHGLGGSCQSEKNLTTFFQAPCIETGSLLFSLSGIKSQGQYGCIALKSEMQKNPEIFKNGLYLIGLSQGGLILRWIYKHCDNYISENPIRNSIKRILTIGTPNLGINHLPDEWNTKSNDDLPEEERDYKVIGWFKDLVFNKASSHNSVGNDSGYSPFCYINQMGSDGGVYASGLIDDLLNDDYSGLEFMLNFVFKEEQIVNPIHSTAFNSIIKENGTFEKFSESFIYKEKILNLNVLYDTGRFFNCIGGNKHLSFNDNDAFFLNSFLEDCGDDFDNDFKKYSIFTYKQCFVNKLLMFYEINKKTYVNYQFLKCDTNIGGLISEELDRTNKIAKEKKAKQILQRNKNENKLNLNFANFNNNFLERKNEFLKRLNNPKIEMNKTNQIKSDFADNLKFIEKNIIII